MGGFGAWGFFLSRQIIKEEAPQLRPGGQPVSFGFLGGRRHGRAATGKPSTRQSATPR
jgi:hypothetical protein